MEMHSHVSFKDQNFYGKKLSWEGLKGFPRASAAWPSPLLTTSEALMRAALLQEWVEGSE